MILKPDIIAMGKGVGNGYPVSVTAISKKVAGLLEKTEFHYAQSHQNDPLGAAVVKELIETIIDEKLIHKSEMYGHRILSALIDIKQSNKLIKNVRGRGLMIAIEIYEQGRGHSKRNV